MASILTLRIDEKTKQRITRIARRKRVSASAVVREAIAALADREEPVAYPYEAIKDLIGVAHGGDPTRSTRTGERFTKLLKAKRDRDRS